MAQKITLALAGNPNAGKTTIFNALTGARQHVGNWPGVTVEKKEGSVRHNGREIHVVDLPGTYSLTAYSLEEIIARSFIIESLPEVVIDVVDASNLERNLYLAVQLLEMGVPIVIAMNMIDVAESRRVSIDVDKLSQLLGAPVVPTNGKKGIGVQDLLDRAVRYAEEDHRSRQPVKIQYGAEEEEELAKIEEKLEKTPAGDGKYSLRWLAVKLLEGDPEVTKKVEAMVGRDGVFDQVEESRRHLNDIFGDTPDIILADGRYGFISGAVRQAVRVELTDRVDMSEEIDKVLTNRLVGPIILFAVLYGVYKFVFDGSEPVVGVFERFFAWFGATVASALPEGLLQSLIVSGVIDGVGGVLGFTPLIAFMFLAIAILEDTGYMARIAFMLDRVLKGFGLHGSSMLALMVSGGLAGGCAVPGIMATRTMKEPKERLVTILIAPLMNCGAKLPVYALLIGAFFPGNTAMMMFLLTLISWSMALIAGRVIRATVLSGPSAPFVLELPPYRIPTLRGLLIHTWERTWMYVKKAGTVILAVSIVLWAMMTFPGLSEKELQIFRQQKEQVVSAFLADPVVSRIFDDTGDLDSFRAYRERVATGVKAKPPEGSEDFATLARALAEKTDKPIPAPLEGIRPSAGMDTIAGKYLTLRQSLDEIEIRKRREHLRSTIGGRLGVALEWVFKPMGFDWKTNIALVGGFAAKEVVVSTMGTAYSLGELDPESAQPLSEKLKEQPGWNKLKAFTLILFVMLYAPCFVTLVVIRRETGTWRWSLFAMVYTTALAYCVALAVHTAGSYAGLGV